mgnify:CR=1 FL=1
MDIDGAELDLGVAAPDGVEKLLAREDATRPLDQMAQEAEFGRAEMDGLAGAGDAVGG